MTTTEKVPELVEFRNYRIAPGATDAFIEHFERHFLESQEALGMEIVGQFRVLDDPERFVWIRRYREPASRGAALERFYTGSVWSEFGLRANELMVEYHDVHLLVPDRSAPEFALRHVPHAARAVELTEPRSTVIAALYEIEQMGQMPELLAAPFDAAIATGGSISELGRLVTAPVANDFPRLPVHEDVAVALWLLSDDEGGAMSLSVARELANTHGFAVRTMRLAPTRRSTLR